MRKMGVILSVIVFLSISSQASLKNGFKYHPFSFPPDIEKRKDIADRLEGTRTQLKTSYDDIEIKGRRIGDIDVQWFSLVEDILSSYQIKNTNWQDLCVPKTSCPYQNSFDPANWNQYDLNLYPELMAFSIKLEETTRNSFKDFRIGLWVGLQAYLQFEKPIFLVHPNFIAITRRGLKAMNSGSINQLSKEDLIHLMAMYNGINYRFRGGGLLQHPQLPGSGKKRNYFHRYPIRSTLMALGLNKNNADRVAQASHAAIKQGWGDYYDMGYFPPETTKDQYHDLTLMTLRGRYQTARIPYKPGSFPSSSNIEKHMERMGYDSSIIRITGLHMGVCYLAGWELIGKFGDPNGFVIASLSNHPYLVPHEQGATNFGEICMGSVLGFGLAHSVLNK